SNVELAGNDQADASLESEQLRHDSAQQRTPLSLEGHLWRPQLGGQALAGGHVVAQRHHRGVDAAAAAADHQVHVDALAVEHLPHAQRRGALHRAGTDDDGDALAAHAAKLATASSTPAKIFRMVAKPLSSSTLRTFGLMSARRRSPPRRRASLTVASSARRPALLV